MIGIFMAVWIILYGAVQASAPGILRAKEKSLSQVVALARGWVGALVGVPFALALAAWLAPEPGLSLTVFIVLGLLVFGAIFAVNSSLHSYLILAFTSAGRVTMDVGFYYMANAAGRLLGTLLSGLSYQMRRRAALPCHGRDHGAPEFHLCVQAQPRRRRVFRRAECALVWCDAGPFHVRWNRENIF